MSLICIRGSCLICYWACANGSQEDNEQDIAAEALDGSQRGPEGTNPNGGLLSVTIHQAEDVEGKHHTNPYVEVQFRGDKKKTSVSMRPGHLISSPRENLFDASQCAT